MQRIPYYGVGDATTDAVTALIVPQLKKIVSESMTAADPTIRSILREEVLPKFGLAVVLGMVGGAIAAAAIGSWFATRRRS